jgi:radical SAM superfamily enzyme YgiQ (UPF0313 family)
MNSKRKTSSDEEVGAIRKQWQGRVRVALVYPNHYAVGMSNLGFQTVYKLLNGLDHVLCERAFLPDSEQDRPGRLCSLESGRPLSDFDIVAFSISFENDYPHVLSLLQKAGLPLSPAHRGASLPLALAGGVACFLNPEPLAPFFDCFLLGEAETIIGPFFDRFDPAMDRSQMLKHLACSVPGVYVPCFYRETYAADVTLRSFTPVEDVPAGIQRIYTPDLSSCETESVIHTSRTCFNDAHLIEVSRGCPHGCRFCSAGFVYRPPRTRTLPQLLQSMGRGAVLTQKIGLMGAAVSDLPELKSLCLEGQSRDLQLSFSSLRADALDDDLIAALRAGRLKTATIAPETGSERMRRVINKGLEQEDILAAAEKLVASGIPNLKLYFMVGLPTETDEDIQDIIRLVKMVKHRFLGSSRARGRMGEITVSLNSFVPKPFTPFQWVPMDDIPTLKKKIQKVKAGLKKVANVRIHADIPRWANLQGILSRGDRRVAQLLWLAHENHGNWPQTFKSSAINPSFYVLRQRSREELLPWDFIDHGLDKDFLWNEYQRALADKTSRSCSMETDTCRVCGVCRK